jgi:hypothetical protein
MPFGTAQVVTTKGKAMLADRLQTTPTTYTTSPKFLGMGVGATAAARTAVAADTALSSEVETRTTGTTSNATITTTGDTFQVIGTITASATRSVDELGLFDASSSGNMGVSATFAVIPLSLGDGIQFTVKVQIV